MHVHDGPVRARVIVDRSTPVRDLPEFLTVAELAAYLAVGQALAYDFARAHGVRLPAAARATRSARCPRGGTQAVMRPVMPEAMPAGTLNLDVAREVAVADGLADCGGGN